MSMQTYDEAGGQAMPTASAGAGAAALINGNGAMTATARAESARAMAEVMAQVQVAQAVPRNMRLARERVKDSCDQFRFAKAAFYAYRRGSSTITGPTIKLIRELAAAFGNFQWGLVEVDRDASRGYSMMMAWAWDVQTNARDSTTFMVRAVRDLAPDEEGGERRKVPLVDERDIYENNANMGSRRVRAMMQTLLPAWYVEEAEEWCRATIARGPVNPATGKPDPLPVRLANAVELFAKDYQVRPEQLEEYVGAPFPKWGANDLVRLITLYESLVRGDIRRDQAFPPAKATAGDVAAAQASAQAAEPAPAGDGAKQDEPPAGDGKQAAGRKPAGEPAAPGDPMTGATQNAIETAFATCGWAGRGNGSRRITVAATLAGAAGLTRWEDFTEAQGQAALAALQKLIEDTPPGGRRDAVHDVYSKARAAAHQARLAEQRAARSEVGEGDAAASGGDDAGRDQAAGAEHAAADVPAAAADTALGQAAAGEPPAGDQEEPPGGDQEDPPGDGPASDAAMRALLTRLTGVTGLRGTGEGAKGRRRVIIGVLVTGHWHRFGADRQGRPVLTEDEAQRAIARFDELAATEAGRKSMAEVMRKIHDDAIAQRDHVEQPGVQGDGQGGGR